MAEDYVGTWLYDDFVIVEKCQFLVNKWYSIEIPEDEEGILCGRKKVLKL